MDPRSLRSEVARRTRTALVSMALLTMVLTGLMFLSRPAPRHAAAETPAPAQTPTAYELQGPLPEAVAEEPWVPPSESAAAPNAAFVRRLQHTLLWLGAICLLIWGVLRLLAPMLGGAVGAPAGRKGVLRVVERHALGPGRAVMLVQAAGRYLVVGVSESSMTTLAELSAEEMEAARAEDEPVPAPAAPHADGYRQVLQHYLSIIPGLGGSRR